VTHTLPKAKPSEFQQLVAEYIRRHPTLRVEVSIDDIARATATSLNLEGFNVTAEELKDKYGPPRS
jgi:hypothetical protein